MGIWEVIGSTSEAVKRNAPDLTPVKNASRASYDYGAASCARIDQAVRANGFAPDLTRLKNATRASYDYGAAACSRLNHAARTNGFHGLTQWMPENKTIGLFASKFAKHTAHYALQEGYKLIPGGAAVSKIITNTLNDVRNENLKAEKLRASSQENVVTPSIGGRYLIDGADMLSREGEETVSNKGYNLNLTTKETPEDVIRLFMTSEFYGTRFLDDLMVPIATRGKKTG